MIKLFLFLCLYCSRILGADEVVQLNLAYGENEKHKLDLYLPGTKTKSYPVVVMIHGGAWRLGDKANPKFLNEKRKYFISKGWAVVSVNYQLSPDVVHPVHVEDVCAAVAWLQQNGKELQLKADQMMIVGHSAGAHLAAMVGIDHTRLNKAGGKPEWIKKVCLIDGACYNVPKAVQKANVLTRKIYDEAFGKDLKVQKDASPTLKLKQGLNYPSFLILVCENRETSVEQGKELHQSLKLVGAESAITEVANKTHRTINEDFGKVGDPTTKALEVFLK